MADFHLLLLAGGRGTRVGGTRPKQFLEVAGRSVLQWSLAAFRDRRDLAGVCIIHPAGVPPDPVPEIEVPVELVEGGEERAHSVLAGLDRLAERLPREAVLLIHDAARPCVSGAELDALLEAGPGHLLAVPLSDTLKSVDGSATVVGTSPREGLWRALTPQCFGLGPLLSAYREALISGVLPTDESQAMELAGYPVNVVIGASTNLKITTASDLRLADAILSLRTA